MEIIIIYSAKRCAHIILQFINLFVLSVVFERKPRSGKAQKRQIFEFPLLFWLEESGKFCAYGPPPGEHLIYEKMKGGMEGERKEK